VKGSDAFQQRARAYWMAFEGVRHRAWWARLGARLWLARLAGFSIADKTWLAIVLADLEQFCRARTDQTTFVADDPSGRIQAYAEGLRQAYLRIRGMIDLTPAEYQRALALLEREEREDQSYAA